MPGRFSPNQLRGVICLTLALGTLALYWPVTHHDFINVDDPRFVTENAQVQAGLTWPGIVWAFHSVYTEAWQPLTWMSHMLDCQLYGLQAGGHHFTSVLFHMANTLLLFLWLQNLTRAAGRSAFVAAFFAWHPLHVESVAWVCERKDVLGAFFWLLALLAYTRQARKPGVGAYLLVLGLYALGLMSKPMVITLPCVLLLLDFWPLNRLGIFAGNPDRNLAAIFKDKTIIRQAALLVAEKIPFFVLAAGMSAATLFAQKAGGSLASIGSLPFHIRLANALASYLSYVTKTFWPSGLAYFYPYSFDIPLTTVLGGALLLMIWTAWFLMRARQQPCLLTGWLWFVGTLVPTIGLVQFCIQAKADRYTYIPSIGLFIVVVWGLSDLFERWPTRRKFLPVLGGLALAGCLAMSSVQLSYWQNSITISRHAIEVTENDYVAYESLGEAINGLGQPERAASFFAEAVRLAPNWPQGQFNFGITLSETGQTNDAIEHLQAGVKLAPDFAQGHYSLGQTLLRFGKTDDAIREFGETVRLDPNAGDAQRDWGVALAAQNKTAEAMPHFSEALRLKPGDPKAHYRFAQALAQDGKFAGAVAHFREALRAKPDFPEAKSALEQILSAHPELK